MKRKLLRCMTALTALLFASCSSDPYLSLISDNGTVGEEVDVTFSISAEDVQTMTRADGDADDPYGPGQWQTVIGRGTKIDMLICAVYEVNEKKDEDGKVINTTYELQKQYGYGIDVDNDGTPVFKVNSTETEKGTPALNEKSYDGQTIYNVQKEFQEKKPKEITLRLMRGKSYAIAFWAQSSQTTAFNTDKLEDVKVIYDNAENNDEFRDAFCKVERFTASATSQPRTVILTRPFAQINLGTTGADYRRVIGVKKTTFLYSTVTLKGVSETINVVEDKIENATDKEVTFSLKPLPAYVNVDVMKEWPELTEDGIFKMDALITDRSEKTEEFLIVNLNDETTEDKGKIDEYVTEYPTIAEDGKYKTETFKYLSMCYALVPASKNPSTDYDDEIDAEVNYTSSTVEVSVTLKTDDDENVEKHDAIEDDPDSTEDGDEDENNTPILRSSTITVKNAPVCRNYRTNILCGLWDKNPDDEQDPPGEDDPTSIFKQPKVRVFLHPAYDGDYNKTDTERGEQEWDNKSSGQEE